MRVLWWIIGITGVFLLFIVLIPALTGTNLFNTGILGPPQTGEEQDTAEEPVTDILVLVDPSDSTDLVGRDVILASVPVIEVVNERVFWVGPAQNQRVLVVYDQKQISIQPGQEVALLGSVRLIPPIEDAMQMWNLPEEQQSLLQDEDIYLQASQVRVAQ